jgi:2-dehydropantoate 2-reductase
MRVIVVGTGAVGGYFGARLVRSGAEVTFVARGEHGRAIRERGLSIISPDGDFSVRAPVIERVTAGSRFDLALVAVKNTALPEVARDIGSVLHPSGVAVSTLNGVTSDDVLGDAIGRERVVGAVAMFGGRRQSPGVIRHNAHDTLAVGEPWPPGQGNAARVVEFLQRRGLPAVVEPQLRARRWWKMAWNCPFNSITALARCTVGDVMAEPKLRNLARGVAEEVAAVARAAGVAIADNVVDQIMGRNGDLGHLRPSMLGDIEAGRVTENEALCGAIARLGAQHGVGTPLSSTLHALIGAWDARFLDSHVGAHNPVATRTARV